MWLLLFLLQSFKLLYPVIWILPCCDTEQERSSILGKDQILLLLFAIWIFYVGFDVLIAVVIKWTIFWDIKLCSLLKVNWLFRGTYRPHLQGQRISHTGNQYENRLQASKPSVGFQWTTRCYIPEDSTDYFSLWIDSIQNYSILFFSTVLLFLIYCFYFSLSDLYSFLKFIVFRHSS
jgi:hypothetical protein